MSTRDQIFGIDFSGSRLPGNSIWITSAQLDADGGLSVEETKPAREWVDASGREAVLAGLEHKIRTNDSAVFGLDFPFGVPADTTDADDWTSFLEEFATEFENEDIDAFPGPYKMDGATMRDFDYRYGGQSPFSPQVKYMVFHGLRDLLWPLVDDDAVSVLPMHSQRDDTPVVIEVYPAATLGRLCLYRTGYKGTGDDEKRRRRYNIEELRARSNIELPPELVSVAVNSDDALDSICAAVATWRAVSEGLEREYAPVEGYVYV